MCLVSTFLTTRTQICHVTTLIHKTLLVLLVRYHTPGLLIYGILLTFVYAFSLPCLYFIVAGELLSPPWHQVFVSFFTRAYDDSRPVPASSELSETQAPSCAHDQIGIEIDVPCGNGSSGYYNPNLVLVVSGNAFLLVPSSAIGQESHMDSISEPIVVSIPFCYFMYKIYLDLLGFHLPRIWEHVQMPWGSSIDTFGVHLRICAKAYNKEMT